MKQHDKAVENGGYGGPPKRKRKKKRKKKIDGDGYRLKDGTVVPGSKRKQKGQPKNKTSKNNFAKAGPGKRIDGKMVPAMEGVEEVLSEAIGGEVISQTTGGEGVWSPKPSRIWASTILPQVISRIIPMEFMLTVPKQYLEQL